MRQAEEPHYVMDSPAYYTIELQGRLSPDWSDRLGGLAVTCTETDARPPLTTLNGWLLDQAALAGVLISVYNFGLALLSVTRSETAPRAESMINLAQAKDHDHDQQT